MSSLHRFVLPVHFQNFNFALQEDFAKIEDEATDEELDMLDLAFGLTEESRLGCQVQPLSKTILPLNLALVRFV